MPVSTRPILALFACLPLTALAQEGAFQMPNLEHLEKLAAETVNLTLDSDALKLAGGFVDSHATAAQGREEIKDVIQGLQAVNVRSFEFAKPNAYKPADVDAVRRQLENPAWTKLVSTRSAEQSVDVFLRKDQKDGGVVIISAEPTELTIVSIVGKIDLEKLRQLQGRFGVPSMGGAAGAAASAGTADSPAPAHAH